MKLFINTLSNKKIFLALLHPVKSAQGGTLLSGVFDRINKKGKKVGIYQNKGLLPCLDRFFKKNRFKFKNLNGIMAINGPGSFTRLRTCLTILNVLSCFLNIKSVGVKLEPYLSNTDLVKQGLRLISKQKKLSIF